MARCAIFGGGGESDFGGIKIFGSIGGAYENSGILGGIAEMLSILLRVRFCCKVETWRNRIKRLPTSRFAY